MDRPTAAAEITASGSALTDDFLAALAGPAPFARTSAAHLTASGVVLDPTGRSTLLVLHRRVGLWLQPGGHVDDTDLSLAAAGLREAAEETGLTGLTVDPRPVGLDRHPAPCGALWHLDVQFVVRAPALAQPTVSEESLDVRWWPVDALPQQRIDLSGLIAAATR